MVEVYTGGRRTSATGAIFKRELKTNDSIQGSQIKDAAVSPRLPDVYDGTIAFYPVFEKSVSGSNLETGEISLGDSYASAHYLIETPVKRAPSFGAGDLIGIDLNLFHGDINFNQNKSLADIEIYKFKREISDLTSGSFGVPETENLIVGVSRYARSGGLITESFNSEHITSSGSNVNRTKTGEIFLEAETAYKISKKEIDVYDGGSFRSGTGADSLSEFIDDYCIEYAGRYICKLVETPSYIAGEKYLHPSRGVGFWSNDPMYFRPAIDYDYCLDVYGQEWWDTYKTQNLIKSIFETSTNKKAFSIESVVTPNNSIFSYVNTRGDQFINTRDDEGNPIYQNFARAHFTNESESGNGMTMNTFFDQESTLAEKQQFVQCTLRLPKPLEIAREPGNSEDSMNSLEVDIRFSINTMTKQHISNIADDTKFGFNMLRCFGMMVATRRPGFLETIGDYIANMNQVGGVTDSKNRVADETENVYSGWCIMRNNVGGAENDDPYDGELKIHWSEEGGNKGWSGVHATGNITNGMGYVMKNGADNDTNPGSGGGSSLDADYVDALQPQDSTKAILQTKEYYTVKLLINNKQSEGAMDATWILLSKDNEIIATRRTRHVGGSTTSTTNREQAFPRFLTLFVNNCDVGGYDELLSTTDGAIFNTNAVSSDVSVTIDSIRIDGFEADVANMSTAPRNPNRQVGTIKAGEIGAIDTDGTFTEGSAPPYFGVSTPAPTYLSFGTESDVFASSNTVNVFMGGFSCVNPKFNDASDNAKSMSVDDSGGRDSGQANLSHKDSDVILKIPDNSSRLGMWPCAGANTHLDDSPNRNDALLLEGTNYVDDFTKKGFFTIDFSSVTDPANYIKRENPLMSTKVTSIINHRSVTVLNPSVLAGFDDDEFIIYRAGYAYNTNKIKTVTLKNSRTIGEVLEFNEIITTADGGGFLGVITYLDELYISPKKFWFLLEVYNLDTTNNEPLPDKQYEYAILQKDTAPGSTTRGITFNESLYSDTSGDSNRWKLSKSHVGGLIEDSVDYGYGTYKDGEDTLDFESGAGYVAKYTPQADYQAISLDGLVNTEKNRLTKPDEKVSLYIKASEETEGVCSIRTTKFGSGGTQHTSDPFFTFYYVDGLPTIEDFKISPNKDNPVFADFEWSSKDDDLWYGFMMFSNNEIKHQYHDAVAVLHLNETDVSSTSNIKLRRYDGVHNGTEVEATAIGGTMATSTEGLAGNALLTDASEGCFVTWADAAYTQPTNEFSVVAHFTCDSIAHAGFVVGKFGEFDISVDTSGNVNAAITPQGGTEVTLKSTSIINTDGETPTNVILTFDKTLVSGNVKLFINGKLEDQTGLRTATGSANNWKSDTNLANDTDSRLTVGIEPVDGTSAPSANGFSGKIEEIVLYNKAIYPVVPRTGKFTFTKPIEELSIAPIATGISNVARLFIKDYHNIRGTSSTQVAASSNIAYKKAGFGLRTDTG